MLYETNDSILTIWNMNKSTQGVDPSIPKEFQNLPGDVDKFGNPKRVSGLDPKYLQELLKRIKPQ